MTHWLNYLSLVAWPFLLTCTSAFLGMFPLPLLNILSLPWRGAHHERLEQSDSGSLKNQAINKKTL